MRDTQRVKIWRKNLRSLTLPLHTLSVRHDDFLPVTFSPSSWHSSRVCHSLPNGLLCVWVDQNLIFDTKFVKKSKHSAFGDFCTSEIARVSALTVNLEIASSNPVRAAPTCRKKI